MIGNRTKAEQQRLKDCDFNQVTTSFIGFFFMGFSRSNNNNDNNNRCLSRNPRDKRANRVVPHRRKEARWANTRPMAERQVYAGTWRSYALWLNHTSLGPPARQVLQRNSPLLAKRKNMPALEANTSLHPSRSKPWALRTRQLANSLPIWEERSHQTRAMRGKEPFCSRVLRCWCSATTLSCYTTPCQPLTARTDDLYAIVYNL